MSIEQRKTIKQLADELHVTKTTVRKYMSDAIRTSYTTISGSGKIEISEAGCKLIAQAIAETANRKPEAIAETANRKPEAIAETANRKPEAIAETANRKPENSDSITVPLAVWETLQAQLSAQQKQIDDYSARLQEVTQALIQAQALHAGTIQEQLPAPKKEKEPMLISRLFRKRH